MYLLFFHDDLKVIKAGLQIGTYHTFHIHKQDVFLNMAKRMARQLQGTGLMEKIWREVIKRFLRGDNVITELQSLSDMPERYFPLEPLGVKDNYGVA